MWRINTHQGACDLPLLTGIKSVLRVRLIAAWISECVDQTSDVTPPHLHQVVA